MRRFAWLAAGIVVGGAIVLAYLALTQRFPDRPNAVWTVVAVGGSAVVALAAGSGIPAPVFARPVAVIL